MILKEYFKYLEIEDEKRKVPYSQKNLTTSEFKSFDWGLFMNASTVILVALSVIIGGVLVFRMMPNCQ